MGKKEDGIKIDDGCAVCGRSPSVLLEDKRYRLCISCIEEEIDMRVHYQWESGKLREAISRLSDVLLREIE